MKVCAVRKRSGILWLDTEGNDSYRPCLMDAGKAQQVARVGAVIEVYECTLIDEYPVVRVALPDLKVITGGDS